VPINAGGANQEVGVVASLGSIILKDPLMFSHQTSEHMVRLPGSKWFLPLVTPLQVPPKAPGPPTGLHPGKQH
jgi:hypothetical protein